jgi:hypothetical protein
VTKLVQPIRRFQAQIKSEQIDLRGDPPTVPWFSGCCSCAKLVMVKSIFLRPWDLLCVSWFLIHIPMTVLLDSQSSKHQPSL